MTLSSVFNSGSLGGSGFSTFIFTFSVETIVLGFSEIPTCFLGGSVETIVLGFSAIPTCFLGGSVETIVSTEPPKKQVGIAENPKTIVSTEPPKKQVGIAEKPKTIVSTEKVNIKVEKPEPPKEPELKTEERVIETPQYTLSPKLTEKQKIGAIEASERLMKEKRGTQSTLPGVAGPIEAPKEELKPP